MRKYINLVVLFLLPVVVAFSQSDIREEVYVHLNSQILVSGETMYFAAYCNNRFTGRPSEMSKILYVEIIGESGQVYQQKVFLDNGRGSADFFISSLIPSGKYYLLAYTRWMKNFDDYFQCPVLIINPFESYPSQIIAAEPDVHFFPLHDPLVAGVENVVAFYLKAENPLKYSGRVVSSQGDMILTIKPDRFGLGKIKFTPQQGLSYQFMLEDTESRINFYDLPPVAKEGAFIVYKEDKGTVEFKCEMRGNMPDKLNLTLFSDGRIFYQTEVYANVFEAVPGGFLSSGYFLAQYSGPAGEVIAERPVFLLAELLSKKNE